MNCVSLLRLQKKHSVLMSVIAGEAVASVRNLDDKQVLQQCMATLRELFKEQVRRGLFERRVLLGGWSPEQAVLTETEGVEAGGPVILPSSTSLPLPHPDGLLGLPHKVPQPAGVKQWKSIF